LLRVAVTEALLQLKSEMRLTTMAVWIFVAVSCAALPFLHAVPALTRGSSGDLWPLLLAVLIGLVACIALSAIAAAFGLASWGVPVGLLFTVDNYLRSKSFSVLTSSAVIWPLAGLAFGLVMRWMSQWGKKKSQA
jgi:hypothetical protein